MSGLAGKHAKVMIPGTAVAFTGEATTDAGDHKTYQITNTAKRVWDPTAAITVKIGGVVASPTGADPFAINRLAGKVIFTTANAGRAAVTVDGQYLPMSQAAEAKTFSFSVTGQNVSDNAFGDDWMTRVLVGRDISGSLGLNFIDHYFSDALLADTLVVLQFYITATQLELSCWARLSKRGVQAALRGLVEESVDFEGTTDADSRVLDTVGAP